VLLKKLIYSSFPLSTILVSVAIYRRSLFRMILVRQSISDVTCTQTATSTEYTLPRF